MADASESSEARLTVTSAAVSRRAGEKMKKKNKEKCVEPDNWRYSLGVDAGQMHDAGPSASAVLDEIARGEDDAARTAEHHRGVRVLHRRLHDDAGLLREIGLPGPAKMKRIFSIFFLSELRFLGSADLYFVYLHHSHAVVISHVYFECMLYMYNYFRLNGTIFLNE